MNLAIIYPLIRSKWIVFVLFFSVMFIHVWKLTGVPSALYVDEVANGYNGYLIASTGHDEHGQLLPLFFKSFGDYKHPLTIYTTAVLFAIFGPSEYGIRFTSSIFFALFLSGALLFTRELFPGKRSVLIYACLAAGFLPWFFTYSRIGFDVIGQLAVTMWALVYIYRTYHGMRFYWSDALLAGFLVGLSLYSYSTARLLTFLLLVWCLLIHARLKTWRHSLVLVTSFIVTSIPYIVFAIHNPDALAARFRTLSYVYNPGLSLTEKLQKFFHNYFSYFDLDFLLFTGDPIAQHATGFGGQVYFIVFILALVGIGTMWMGRDGRFRMFLLTGLLSAPAAAALTDTTHHATRSILVGLYLLLFSLYGFVSISKYSSAALRRILLALIFLGVFGQASLYVHHYFTDYTLARGVYEIYNFPQALKTAIDQRPSRIVISDQANQPYIYKDLYQLLIPNPQGIPIVLAPPLARSGECLIYFMWNEGNLPVNPLPHIQLVSLDMVSRVRCY